MRYSEFEYIRWIRRNTPAKPQAVPIPPGDDMGAFAPGPDEPVLVKVDMIMEGTDFVFPDATPEQVGFKAMAVSLSDVAAMAAWPKAAVASVSFDRNNTTRELQEGLHHGMRKACDAFGCPIIGGDVNAWDGKLVLSTTVLAQPAGVSPVLRSGARVGDRILVTGKLGGSILGRHLCFTPRIREARALAGAVDLHSMIDLSDGLSSDLNHICRESEAGAIIDADAIPISEAAVELSKRSGKPPLEHALHDGEDFELLLTVSDDNWFRLTRKTNLIECGFTCIGQITAERDVLLKRSDGSTVPLAAGGWEHLRAEPGTR